MTDTSGRNRTPHPTSAARAQSVRIALDGITLDGDLTVPRDAHGLVLFAHGSGSSRHSPRNQHVAAALHSAGLATLLFDLLTPDEERVDARTGELRFDIPLLATRLGAVTDVVAHRPELCHLGVGYFGASTGAAAALVAAADRPGLVGAVVSRGGRPDLAGSALARVTTPTLLIVGGADTPVIALNQQALHAIAAPKRLAIVTGATHLFEEPGTLDEVALLAREWFARHLHDAAARATPSSDAW